VYNNFVNQVLRHWQYNNQFLYIPVNIQGLSHYCFKVEFCIIRGSESDLGIISYVTHYYSDVFTTLINSLALTGLVRLEFKIYLSMKRWNVH
jgi:hypothetical protein